MLNHVWMFLIAIAIAVAVGSDIKDEIQNPYRNGCPLDAVLIITKTPASPHPVYEGELVITKDAWNNFYSTSTVSSDVRHPVKISTRSNNEMTVSLPVTADSPALWKTMAKSSAAKEQLSGIVKSFSLSEDTMSARFSVVMEKITFVKIRAVTKAALEYADIAVTLSIGLIGIMALWLGVMKVAEEAGLLKVLTRVLTPVTRRLFPDVPADHPAVGAMIMNIAANMLGLNNAATPLGLKAMEELNKLNPKVGTATNAMCTFLVINTAGLTLIPATAIALRAAAGSADPAIIVATSIFGAGCATIGGLTAVKLLQRLPKYKKELEVDNG